MTYEAAVLALSPFCAYHLEETTNVNLDDYGPGNRSGFQDGTFGYGVTGVVNNCFQFNGTNAAIRLPVTAGSFNPSFTLVYWYKYVSGTPVVWRDNTSTGGWLFLNAATTANMTLRANGTDRTLSGAGTVLRDGAFHAVMHSVTGTSILTEIRSVTGALEYTDTWTVTVNASTIVDPLRFGKNGLVNQFQTGIVDEPAIFQAALTSAQFQTLWGEVAPPGIPTFVFQTDSSDTMLELSWLAPSTGGTVTSYQVRLDFGTPVTATSPHQFTGLTPATSYTMEVRAVGPGGSSAWVTVLGDTDDEPPGPPTDVVGTPLAVTAELAWNNPATGGAFTSFDVRLDGGTIVTGASSPHVFTGLTPETAYDLEVRAVGPGGESSWVLVTVTTTEDVAYRARVTLGDHVWDVTFGEDCDYGPTLPLTLGWEIPESADFFPAQASPMTASFGLVVESVADVADLALMDPALIELFVPASDPDAFIYFPAVISQLEATVGQGGRNLLQVFLTDPIYSLSVVQVGLEAYAEESEFARVESIAADAEIDADWVGLSLGASGTLAATNAGAATDALSALQATLRDVSDLNTSGGSDVYGRVVYAYDPTLETLYLRVLTRIYFEWPALLGDDGTLHLNPGVDGALDGCNVETAGTWSRLPMDRPTWVIVDGIPFGAEDKRSDVLIRSTPYVDVEPDNSGTANARDRLGNVLLPPDPDPVAWRANTFRYLSHLDPEPVRGWFGLAEPVTSEAYVSMPWADGGIRGVFVSPVAPELTLDGRTWLSGTLTGARFTLPPGGKHYVDVTLRPELYEVDPLETPEGPLTWADVDGALTWADLDPLLTWRDLRLVSGG